MAPAKIIQLNIAAARKQRWRESGWRLLSACFHNEGFKEIQSLCNDYWAAVRGMRAE